MIKKTDVLKDTGNWKRKH